MKRIISFVIALVFTCLCQAQVYYFKGEWTVKDKTDLFTCLCKLEIKNGDATAEFVWTYVSIDSTNAGLTEMYANKKGKSGIEFTTGTYYPGSGDVYLEANRLQDPDEILGMTKYYLKLSAGNHAIYGTTTGLENEEPGLFFALAMKKSKGAKKFIAQKNKVK